MRINKVFWISDARLTLKSYLAKRLVLVPVLIIGVATLTFIIVHAVPGDPIDFYLASIGPEGRDEEVLALLRAEMNLDKPLYQQYAIWIGKVATLDLGTSFILREKVTVLLGRVIWNTLEVMGLSLLIGVVIGIPLGVVTAVRHNSKSDHALRIITLFGISMPIFWLSILVITLFSVFLGWLPSSGRITVDVVFTSPWAAFGDHLKHMVLPVLTLALWPIARISRVTRTCMLEVLDKEYITTARAKGLRERIVIYKHALRNALLPIITVIGLDLSRLLGGAVITETVFAWPGIGRLLVTATYARDYPLILGATIVIAFSVILFNLITDISYSLLDPRIKR